jgi:hypothetical protein
MCSFLTSPSYAAAVLSDLLQRRVATTGNARPTTCPPRALRQGWRRLVVLLLFAMTSASGLWQRDAGPYAAAARRVVADEGVLLVGITRGDRADSKLTKLLSEHLARSGQRQLSRGSLTPADQLCTRQECLEKLAQRESAKLLLTAHIPAQPEHGPAVLTTALYDAEHRVPFVAEAVCEQCSPDKLMRMLSEQSDKVLQRCQAYEPQPTSGATAATPALTPALTPATLGPGSGAQLTSTAPAPESLRWPHALSPRRKKIIGVLGGLAAASLVTSIALTATDKQYTALPCTMTGPEQRCRLDNAGLYAPGYALTGGLLLSAGFLLFWPDATHSTEDKK